MGNYPTQMMMTQTFTTEQAEYQPQHLTQWAESAIDRDIIDLNFRSVGQVSAFSFLIPNPDRRNDGRLTDRHLRTYNRLAVGGWICTGIDPLTMTPSDWGCLKPDDPRWDEAKRKHIKYEHPHGFPPELFCLRVTYRIGLKIAKLQGLGDIYVKRILQKNQVSQVVSAKDKEFRGFGSDTKTTGIDGDNRRESGDDRRGATGDSPISRIQEIAILSDGIDLSEEDDSFWQWVKDTPSLKITITEGAKKAASLLSAGHLAIALPGIRGGYRSKINGVPCIPFLIPQLQVFAANGREIVFCFDNDTKLSTIADVNNAIAKTGKLLKRKGCKVSVIGWTIPYKGVDDLIYNLGEETYRKAFDRRQLLDNWRLSKTFDIAQLPQTRVNTRYLDLLIKPDDLTGKLIAIKSPKGTGKTEYLAKILEPELAKGRSVLVVTHRIQLAKALAKRLGINHLTEVRSSDTGSLLGFALCVDSLHPKSQARFNPEAWDESIVVLDECEQVLWHMLNSPTCQGNRIAILQTFEKLLRTVAESNGTVILSDADLSKVSIDYVQKLTDNRLNLWLLNNSYNPNQGNRKLFSYDSPASLLEAAYSAIEKGERVIIHCSSQKAKSKWSTQNLETALSAAFPSKAIFRADAETVADPSHPAFGCIENINEVVVSYDIVLASPTIETGISIDVNHFDSVWALANGVQTVDAVCQTIERVRSNVDRHICITTSGMTQVGNGSDSPYVLCKSQNKLAQANLTALALSAFTEDEESESHLAHIAAWSNYAAKTNQGYRDYKANILDKLKCEGYDLIVVSPNTDRLPSDKIEEQIVDAKEANYKAERQQKIAAPIPNELQLKALEKKTAKTKAERHIEAKGKLVHRYLTEDITDELIVKDDRGWHPQIQLYYYLTSGREHLPNRDKVKLQALSPEGYKPFNPDINNATLSVKVKALEAINISQFFGEDRTFTNNSLADWFDRLKGCRGDIADYLKIGIGEKSTPITTAQRLLNLLGCKLESIDRIRIDGKLTRRYSGVICDADGRQDVLARWLERDDRAAVMAECSTSSIRSNNTAGGTDHTTPDDWEVSA
jgi:hypothetical protein